MAAPLPAAVWTESLTAALNQSGAVWEMSPVGTVLEARVVRWMGDLAGLGAGAGGVFTSGGTEATFVALLAARAAALPDAWAQGVGPEPPVVLHGEHAHYAVSRAGGGPGLGAAIGPERILFDDTSRDAHSVAHRALVRLGREIIRIDQRIGERIG